MLNATICNDNGISMEIKSFDSQRFCQWNQYTQSLYNFFHKNIYLKDKANTLFFDLFSQNSFVAVLKEQDNIIGVMSSKIVENSNKYLFHIKILAIDKERRHYFLFFIKSICSYIRDTINKDIYVVAETQYESVFKFLSKYTKIIYPDTSSKSINENNSEYEMFDKYYSTYVKPIHDFNNDIYFDKHNAIIKNYCNMIEKPVYKTELFKKLNVNNGDHFVIFGKLYDSDIYNVKKTNRLSDTKFINLCLGEKISSTSKNHIKAAVIDNGIDVERFNDKIEKGTQISYKDGHLNLDDSYNSKNLHGNSTAEIITRYCSKARLIVIKAFSEEKICNEIELIESIKWAADNGAKVMFIGGAVGNTKYLNQLKDVCDYAFNKGCILIAPKDITTVEKSYPCYFDNVIGVSITPYKNLIFLDKENRIMKLCHKWLINNDMSNINFLQPCNSTIGSCIAAAYLTGIICNYLSNETECKCDFDSINKYLTEISLPIDYEEKLYSNNFG